MRKSHPLRQLEELDEELAVRSGYTGTSRWMIPYADFMTLLLGFFIVMFAMMQHSAEVEKPQQTALRPYPLLKPLKPDTAPTPISQSGPDTAMMMVETPPVVKQAQQALQKSLSHQLGKAAHVGQDRRGVFISFQDSVFFEPGRARLTSGSTQTLQKLAGVLAHTSRSVRVEGHTDNTPVQTVAYPSNWELSTARATTIVKYLITQTHFDPHRLSAAGYGEYAPLADNSTIKGKRKNRRVDIVLLDPIASM